MERFLTPGHAATGDGRHADGSARPDVALRRARCVGRGPLHSLLNLLEDLLGNPPDLAVVENDLGPCTCTLLDADGRALVHLEQGQIVIRSRR